MAHMNEKKIEIKYLEAASLEDLNETDSFLVVKAREASKNAWAPYSKFYVGAAVLLENGELILGNNQENAAYPSGLCAERVALFAANANFPNVGVKAIAITAFNEAGLIREAAKPCGSCRQAILESEVRFEKPIRLILDGADQILVMEGIRNLLPFSFTQNDL